MEGESFSRADTKALTEAVSRAELYKKSNYSESSYRSLRDAVEKAKALLLDDEAEQVLRSEESIEENYFRKELIAEVDQVIGTLPEKIRVPLTLFYFSDCSVEQIAAIIKKPPGTVKSRLFKGRKLIKKRLEESGYER